MDDQAVVIRLFDLWDACEKEYRARYDDAINMEILTLIFDRAHHEIISKEIEQRRQGVRVQQKKQQEKTGYERTCIVCGRELTEGEITWIDKHGGKDICYHCKKEIAGN